MHKTSFSVLQCLLFFIFAQNVFICDFQESSVSCEEPCFLPLAKANLFDCFGGCNGMKGHSLKIISETSDALKMK